MVTIINPLKEFWTQEKKVFGAPKPRHEVEQRWLHDAHGWGPEVGHAESFLEPVPHQQLRLAG